MSARLLQTYGRSKEPATVSFDRKVDEGKEWKVEVESADYADYTNYRVSNEIADALGCSFRARSSSVLIQGLRTAPASCATPRYL